MSIVGRFLEHSRIYIFGNPSAQDGSAGVSRDCRIFIGSADFMTRNTERRVEVAVPVFDDDIKNKLVHIFTTVMADNVKGRELTAEKIYVRRTVCDEEKRCSSQEQFYEEAYKAVSRREAQP